MYSNCYRLVIYLDFAEVIVQQWDQVLPKGYRTAGILPTQSAKQPQTWDGSYQHRNYDGPANHSSGMLGLGTERNYFHYFVSKISPRLQTHIKIEYIFTLSLQNGLLADGTKRTSIFLSLFCFLYCIVRVSGPF